MRFEKLKLTREALYEQIWSQPVSKVAKGYGISDVGLAKICRKHDIPLPGRGYWEKKSSGKAVVKKPLTLSKEGRDTVIEIGAKVIPAYIQKGLSEVESKILFEKQPDNKIIVFTQLTAPHPLVARTAASLQNKKTRPDKQGVIRGVWSKDLDISVSPDCLGRALLIMDTLIKALEARGFVVSVLHLYPHYSYERIVTQVLVLGEAFQFNLQERVDRLEKPLTRSSIFGSKHEYRPSGRLILRIETYIEGRKNWSDGSRQRVEDCLNDFIAVLIEEAAIKRAERAEQERRKRLEEEERRRREEAERRQEEEEARIQALIKEAEAWERSRQIRAYINAVKEGVIEKYGQIAPGSKIEQWLTWAQQQADRFDPLSDINTINTNDNS